MRTYDLTEAEKLDYAVRSRRRNQEARLSFASDLQHLMLASNITTQELAKTTGISEEIITGILDRKLNISVEQMTAIARALEGVVYLRIALKVSDPRFPIASQND